MSLLLFDYKEPCSVSKETVLFPQNSNSLATNSINTKENCIGEYLLHDNCFVRLCDPNKDEPESWHFNSRYSVLYRLLVQRPLHITVSIWFLLFDLMQWKVIFNLFRTVTATFCYYRRRNSLLSPYLFRTVLLSLVIYLCVL